MELAFADSFKLSKGAVEEFERDMGSKLPSDYRAFLLSCNGGVLEQPASARGCTIVRTLFGLKVGDPANDIEWNTQAYRKAWGMPEHLIAIADDMSGAICIVIKGRLRGKIYKWTRDYASTGEEPDWGNPIADSFSDFTERLSPVDYDGLGNSTVS